MERRVKKSLCNEGNSSMGSKEKTVNLDSTCDTDIIECSIVDENVDTSSKKMKHNFKMLHDQSPKTPVRKKEFLGFSSNVKNSNKILGLSLRRSFGLLDDKVSVETSLPQTPCTVRNTKDSNSSVKKMISTLKKTPSGPYLSISKLRNIERWLNENEVETVRTPPFANLSVSPVNSVKRRLSCRWKKENVKPEEESPTDSEVEGVLRAVYGEQWQRKSAKGRARTEPKKRSKGLFSPLPETRNKGVGVFHSVRRNILNDKKCNLSEKSDSENHLDDSFVSGIRLINLDGSGCKEERAKTSLIRTSGNERKCEAEESDCESLEISPVRPKRQNNEAVSTSEKRKVSSKSSASKKFPTNTPVKTPKKTFLASLSVTTPTSRCHPDARYYKVNFKSKKEELVKKLFKLYNGEIFDWKLAEDMNFSWNVKLRGTAGYCYNKRVTKSTGEVIRQSRIEFSTKIVDRADRLRDTMIHELCHAASWVIDGVLDGHGEVWSKWASRARDRFPELPAIKRCHNYDIVSKYVYRCTSCGYSIKRHSKSINTERKRCGHCYGVLELLINKKRKGKGEVPEFDTTRTLPTPNKFAMFVKENYRSVKSTKTDAKHSEIMKVLSEKYAVLKSASKSAKKSNE